MGIKSQKGGILTTKTYIAVIIANITITAIIKLNGMVI